MADGTATSFVRIPANRALMAATTAGVRFVWVHTITRKSKRKVLGARRKIGIPAYVLIAKAMPEEEIEYITRDDVNIAILREIERINFRAKLRRLMPMVAQELVAAGVDFSKVDFSKVTDATDSEIDQVFDDLRP